MGESSPEENQDPDVKETNPPGLLQVLLSVAAAAFGVQNSKTRERDFTRGNPLVFIIAGLAFTLAFVLSLILVVYLVIG